MFPTAKARTAALAASGTIDPEEEAAEPPAAVPPMDSALAASGTIDPEEDAAEPPAAVLGPEEEAAEPPAAVPPMDVASGVGSGSDISNTFQRSCSSVRELSTGEPGVCSKSDGQNKSLSCSGVPWPAGMLSNVRVGRKGSLTGDTKFVMDSPNNAVISLWALSCGYKRHSGHRALSG